jgi:hypothetical protein
MLQISNAKENGKENKDEQSNFYYFQPLVNFVNAAFEAIGKPKSESQPNSCNDYPENLNCAQEPSQKTQAAKQIALVANSTTKAIAVLANPHANAITTRFMQKKSQVDELTALAVPKAIVRHQECTKALTYFWGVPNKTPVSVEALGLIKNYLGRFGKK